MTLTPAAGQCVVLAIATSTISITITQTELLATLISGLVSMVFFMAMTNVIREKEMTAAIKDK